MKYNVDLAKPKSKAPDYNKITWLGPAIQSKISTCHGQHSTSKSSKLDTFIWPCDTDLWIPCFGRCQFDHNMDVECVVSENIYTPTTGNLNFQWEWGSQRPRKFRRGEGLDSQFTL